MTFLEAAYIILKERKSPLGADETLTKQKNKRKWIFKKFKK